MRTHYPSRSCTGCVCARNLQADLESLSSATLMHLLSFKINCARKCCASIPLTCSRQRSCSCDLQPGFLAGELEAECRTLSKARRLSHPCSNPPAQRENIVSHQTYLRYLSHALSAQTKCPHARTHGMPKVAQRTWCKPQWHDRLEDSQQNVKFTFRVPDAYFLTDYCTKIGLPKSRIERAK